MYFNKKIILPTLLIFLVGIFIYFYKLDKVPLGLYIDEASPGYDAYSILKTGKDQYGKFTPLVFRSLGAYNPPLYTYFTVIPIAINGLNIFSVRFIASLAGLLSIFPLTGLLFSSGFIKKKIAIYIGTFLFMISPWLLIHSRNGYEVTLGFLFFVTGVYFAWIGIKDAKYFLLSVMFFSLATYASYPARFLSPIFIILFLIFFRKYVLINKNKKYLLLTFVMGLILQIPNLLLLTTPAFFPKSEFFYGKTISSFFREFLSLYFTYFSPKSLFFLGDPDIQRSIPGIAAFYFWEIIPYFVGLYVLIEKRKNIFVRFLLIILVIAPIPAAMTGDPFATHRAIMFLFPLSVLIIFGIDRIIYNFNKPLIIGMFICLIFISLILLWRSYVVLMPHERAKYWGYGTKELAQIIKDNPGKHFIIDTSRSKPAYVNLAFFMKTDPSYFQSTLDSSIAENYYTNIEFENKYNFSNLETRSINWETDVYKDVVLVGDDFAVSESQAVEHGLEKMFEIRDPVGEIIFEGYEK